MIISFMYIILAALGLGVLIFIHELGHYFMARHVGMKVEAFGIGFGKPIYTWKRDDVEWRLCWLPFGGYVKIAGMEAEEGKDPYDIPDGFFGARPIDRIKVAFIGPFVNLVFAFLIFTALWIAGGREKSFSDFTSIIGWVDPHSELYVDGIRPGDVISEYDGQQYQSARDHIFAPMTAHETLEVKGYKVDYLNGEKTPFDYAVKPYPHPGFLEKEMKTSGILASADYIIYKKRPEDKEEIFSQGTLVKDSGILEGDRVVWVDGELIFSNEQLSHILNDGRVLLTVQRGKDTILRRAPAVTVDELKVDSSFKEELTDWQFEAHLNNVKLQKLKTIPYNVTSDNVVENDLKFIDAEQQTKAFPKVDFDSIQAPLQKGDKIIAVDGTPVKQAYQLLTQLQQRHVNIIVENNPNLDKVLSWKEADKEFNQEVNVKELNKLASTIGTPRRINEIGNLKLLNVITPRSFKDLPLSPEAKVRFNTQIQERRKAIEEIQDIETRTQALKLLEEKENQLILGLPEHDVKVTYNPDPVALFMSVFDEIWHTLTALVSGYLNPKWIAGPLGIVQVAHNSLMVSLKDGLFWIGAISLNLGMLNLLPLPVLDGGYICISLYEMISRKRLKPKTMEKLIIPFAVLMIGFFIFLTYNDLLRIFN